MFAKAEPIISGLPGTLNTWLILVIAMHCLPASDELAAFLPFGTSCSDWRWQLVMPLASLPGLHVGCLPWLGRCALYPCTPSQLLADSISGFDRQHKRLHLFQPVSFDLYSEQQRLLPVARWVVWAVERSLSR